MASTNNGETMAIGLHSLSEELEIEVFKHISLFADQLKLAKARSWQVGTPRMISILLKANETSLFRNVGIVRHVFNTLAFTGEAMNPRLRPTMKERLDNPAHLTYNGLIRNLRNFAATPNWRAMMTARLQRTKNKHLIQYRSTAALQSRQERVGPAKPSKRRKRFLGLSPTTDHTYSQLMSHYAGDNDFYLRIKEPRDDDESCRMTLKDKHEVWKCVFDALEGDMDEFRNTRRGCLKNNVILLLPTCNTTFCQDCLAFHCQEEIFDLTRLASININMSSTGLFSCEPWIKPLRINGSQVLMHKHVDTLTRLMYQMSVSELRQYCANTHGTFNHLRNCLPRFAKIMFAVQEARKQYALRDATLCSKPYLAGKTVFDLPIFGLTPHSLMHFAFHYGADVECKAFAELAFDFIARDFDLCQAAGEPTNLEWMGRVVASFWLEELAEVYGTDY